MLGSWASGPLLALVLCSRQVLAQLDIATTVPIPTATATLLNLQSGANSIYQPELGGAVDTLTLTQQWLAEVKIGSQSFNLIVDTGSSDL